MSSAPSPEQIARDATWLVQALDPSQGMARLIAMDRESYRAASFLDDRMVQSPVEAQIVSWDEVEQAASESVRCDARWIFHIGHVGSTLISRLIGELDAVLAIREPRILRDLALTPAAIRSRYIAPIAKLMSRTFAERETACVKATSFASEIAPDFVPASQRAMFVFTNPLNYVASILAGENSVRELHALAASRAARVRQRVPRLASATTNAQRAGAAWACEMTSLEQAAEAMDDRLIQWANFDRMLDDMPRAMAAAAQHFGFAAEPDRLQTIANGPLMARYSKATEYDYSPQLRRDLIAEAARGHAREISEALAMLERAAQDSPLLARALNRSSSEA